MNKIHTKEGKHEIVYFNSAHDLGPRRYQKYNKYEMIAMGVGETIEDHEKRQAKAIGYARIEDTKSLLVELSNQHQCVYNALQEYSPSNMAFAVMVHSIDGKVYDRYDESALDEIIDNLERVGFTKGMLLEALRDVKKK